MWREIKRIIEKNDVFLLTTHLNPDGDGIGAGAAMVELLLQLGKTVRFVCDSPIAPKLQFLDYHNTHEEYDPDGDYSDVQVVLVLDTHRRERIGRVAEIADREDVEAVCIDHHQGGDAFTAVCEVDPNACSVGAMVYTLYKEMGFDLNIRAATGVYTSIICDTGRFSYSSTSRKAHKIADDCIKLGVDPDEMHSRLFQHLSVPQIKIFSRALDSAEYYFGERVVVQTILQSDCEALRGWFGEECPELEHLDLEHIHEFNKLMAGVECVVLLREVGDCEVRVSLRSMGDVDCGSIVKEFGGGGHSKAAGASSKGTVEQVKGKILDLLAQALNCAVVPTAVSQ